MRLYLFYLFLFSLIVFSSCEGETEPIPSYIHIPKASVNNTNASLGSSSSNITSVWVFANQQQIGVFELPVTLPILAEGAVELSFQAGVKVDGISFNLQRYPFYDFYTTTLDLTATEVDTISPVFNYKDSTKIILINDFEENNNFEIKEGTNAFIDLANSPAEVLEGNRSACIRLNETRPNFQMGTIGLYDLPKYVDAFVEFDYLNELEFDFYVTGLDVNGNPFFSIVVNVFPSEEWNKIYMDMSGIGDIVLENIGVEFGFIGSLPDSLDQATVCFDNIKLFHK